MRSRSSRSTSTSSAAYSSHGCGQRARRPVDGRVLLAHAQAEHGLDQRGQADPRVAEQPAGELGVEELGRGAGRPRAGTAGPGWRRAGSTRRRRAPPGAGPGWSSGDRVDQRGAGALAAQLDQVGAVGVAVARGALGVDGDRAGAGGEGRARLGQPGVGLDDLGQAVAQRRAGEREEPRARRSRARRPRVAASGSAVSGSVSGVVGHRQVPRCPRRLGHGDDALGHRRQADGGAQQLAPGLDVRGHVERVVLADAGVQDARISTWAVPASSAIPPKLSVLTQVTRAGGGVVAGAVRLERLGQPATSRRRPASGR